MSVSLAPQGAKGGGGCWSKILTAEIEKNQRNENPVGLERVRKKREMLAWDMVALTGCSKRDEF